MAMLLFMNEIVTVSEQPGGLKDEVAEGTSVFMVIVDDSPEAAKALRYACNRARNRRGRVALLRVIEPINFGHFLTINDRAAAEAETEARDLLKTLQPHVQDLSGADPIFFIEHGEVQPTVVKTLADHPEVSIFVLAAAEGSNPGPLVGALANKIINQVNVPVVVVPGGLTEEQIDAIS